MYFLILESETMTETLHYFLKFLFFKVYSFVVHVHIFIYLTHGLTLDFEKSTP